MKHLAKLLLSIIIVTILPISSAQAAGIAPSGGGSHTEGETFSVSIVASGAEFDSLQGRINVSGNVTVVSIGAGGATWLPGKTPSNGGEFVGIVSPTRSFTVATVKLKGTKPGTASVSVSGAKLARDGSIVGTGGGSSSITIKRALVPAGAITVSSDTHPDQAVNYDNKTVHLTWDKPSGVTEYSYLLDQVADTTPSTTATGTETEKSYTVEKIGVYYFHIRAKNADGWGGATHFKINIVAATDPSLQKPTIAVIEKTADWKMDLDAGTVTGLRFAGTSLNGYKMTLKLEPVVEGLTLATTVGGTVVPSASPETTTSPLASADTTPTTTPTETSSATPTPELSTSPTLTVGDWEIIADKPLRAGFYKATIQGELNEILTPSSEVVKFEISLAQGGSIRIITDADLTAPAPVKTKVLGIDISKHPIRWTAFLTSLLFIIVASLVLASRRIYKLRKPSKLSDLRPKL